MGRCSPVEGAPPVWQPREGGRRRPPEGVDDGCAPARSSVMISLRARQGRGRRPAVRRRQEDGARDERAMSATTVAPATGRTDAPPGGPVPRRVRPPRWLDLRLVLGVLLVLGSVLVGARVVTAADATVPVWSAAGDLAAGTVLAEEDLVAVSVRLDDVAGQYLATSTRPAGRVLGRAVQAGELVPRSSLEEATGLVQLALPVQAGYVPPSLARGQIVDVYAVADPAVGAVAQTGGPVDLVVSAPPAAAVASGGGWGV